MACVCPQWCQCCRLLDGTSPLLMGTHKVGAVGQLWSPGRAALPHCCLASVFQIVAQKRITRPLLLKLGRKAGKSTITVSTAPRLSSGPLGPGQAVGVGEAERPWQWPLH